MNEISSYELIDPGQIEEARAQGLRLHHELEYMDMGDEVLVRDDWYAATQEWVEGYHNSGGTWGYRD
jgi:hypothetical protein